MFGVLVLVSGSDDSGGNVLKRIGTHTAYETDGKGGVTLCSSGIRISENIVLTSARTLMVFDGKEPAEIRVRYDEGSWFAADVVECVVAPHTVTNAIDRLYGFNRRRRPRVRNEYWTRTSFGNAAAREDPFGTLVLLRVRKGHRLKRKFRSVDSTGNIRYRVHEKRNARRRACVRRGQKVRVLSSPFGLAAPSVFQNSVTSGIISNVVNSGALYLTDARCLPGSEGGLVTSIRGEWVGVVMGSLDVLRDGEEEEDRRRRQQTDALTPIIPIDADLLFHMREALSDEDEVLFHDVAFFCTKRDVLSPHANIVTYTSRCVALLSVGNTWSSGIIVAPGYVATCAHVVLPYEEKPVCGDVNVGTNVRLNSVLRVRIPTDGDKFTWRSGQVVYCCRQALDLALVQTVPDDNDPIDWSNHVIRTPEDGEWKSPLPGTPALAVGHALFGPSSALHPSATCGCVSKSVSTSLIQSSATILRGHSGGALVSARDGSLLGLITSHAKLDESDHLVRLNFSVGVETLQHLVRYAQSGDKLGLTRLSEIDRSDAEISVWRLERDHDDNLALSPEPRSRL